MNSPSAMVISGPACASPSLNRMTIASMLRTKLSLKAEKNWVQNSAAKRRARIRLTNIMVSGYSS